MLYVVEWGVFSIATQCHIREKAKTIINEMILYANK